MAKKNYFNLAKKGDEKKPEPKAEKKEEKTVVENTVVLSPEEERDLKAKEKVKELLKDVDLNPDKKDETIELDEDAEVDEPVGVDWLEEQITLLTEQNSALKAELELTKADYSKIYIENQRLKNSGVVGDDKTREIVVNLFNEIQAHYFQSGFHPVTGAPNLILYPVAFMNRMIMFFPFLSQYKKF